MSSPTPENLIAYIEGRIKQKQDIHSHVSACKDCQDVLQAIFSIPTEKELKNEKVPRWVIEKTKNIPKMYPRTND